MNKVYIDIKKWGKVRDLLGLKVQEVRMGEGAETILLVDGPQDALETLFTKKARKTPVEEMKGRRPVNNNRLALTLADMVNRAELKAGTPQREELRGGLRMDIMKGIDGVLRIQISRKGKKPSEKEWETVGKFLPEGMGLDGMVEMEHQGRFFFRGEIK